VLHTWSQNLRHHPHLHCLVPAGGLAPDNSRWIAARRGFFLPVRVLSRMFRGKLLAFLKQSYRRGELCFAGKLAELSTPRAFHTLLGTLRRREWVVYSKPPFGGPEHVLKYLARYTHRVAISNGRLLSLDNGQVRFRWRDSRHNNRSSVMKLDATSSSAASCSMSCPPASSRSATSDCLPTAIRRSGAGSGPIVNAPPRLPAFNTALSAEHCRYGTTDLSPTREGVLAKDKSAGRVPAQDPIFREKMLVSNSSKACWL
jgi:hypothetical protein